MSGGIGDAGAGRADSLAVAVAVLEVTRDVLHVSIQKLGAKLLGLVLEPRIRHLIVAVVGFLVSRVSR